MFAEMGKKMLFIFDYGVNWEFIVRLAKIKEVEKMIKRPVIMKVLGKAPHQYPPLDYGNEEPPENVKWIHDE